MHIEKPDSQRAQSGAKTPPEREALRRAITLLARGRDGAPATVAARMIGVKRPSLEQWVRGERPLPLDRAMQIERLVVGRVKREELRPDVDWSRPKRARSGAAEQKAA